MSPKVTTAVPAAFAALAAYAASTTNPAHPVLAGFAAGAAFGVFAMFAAVGFLVDGAPEAARAIARAAVEDDDLWAAGDDDTCDEDEP